MKDFEKLLKEKLAKDGISEDWMKKHLIVDTIEKEDIDDLLDKNLKDIKLAKKNIRKDIKLAKKNIEEIINLIDGGENE